MCVVIVYRQIVHAKLSTYLHTKQHQPKYTTKRKKNNNATKAEETEAHYIDLLSTVCKLRILKDTQFPCACTHKKQINMDQYTDDTNERMNKKNTTTHKYKQGEKSIVKRRGRISANKNHQSQKSKSVVHAHTQTNA